ncbi:MAG: hypothetical protein QHH14_06240 [Clostridiales bacterium]|nr:hypothetical protein [Clostridiales bacterium]
MRRFRCFAWLLMLAALCPLLLFSQEDFLKVEASVEPRRLSRGEEGAVVLELRLMEGISISPYPDFIIEFKPCPELVFPKNFFTASDLDIEVLEKDGEKYLDFKEPLKIPFTVSLEAKRGSYILEGRIKYFARSQKEGWCVKNTAKFFVTFATRPGLVKKKTAG